MTLQTVILAAGMGSRLGRSLPKPLTELSDGRSIMQQQHDNIRAAFGADARITTVVGYRAEAIVEAFPQVDYVYNDRYDQTNTSKSLLRALAKSGKGGVLWMNGDVVFDPLVLGRAIELIERDQSFVTVNTSKVSDEEVRPLEIFGEVDLDRVQVGDVERLEPHRVLFDRELQAPLEVILVV
ncbi:MAG: phosphocholine cytidylyltransferase family protein, partial [Microbacterium sp.]